MKSLEIRVNDEIKIFDTLVDAINYLTEEVMKWFQSDETSPFSVFIRKEISRGPPSLNVSVSDGIGTRSGLV